VANRGEVEGRARVEEVMGGVNRTTGVEGLERNENWLSGEAEIQLVKELRSPGKHHHTWRGRDRVANDAKPDSRLLAQTLAA
jgi:hypothetical protein